MYLIVLESICPSMIAFPLIQEPGAVVGRFCTPKNGRPGTEHRQANLLLLHIRGVSKPLAN